MRKCYKIVKPAITKTGKILKTAILSHNILNWMQQKFIQ